MHKHRLYHKQYCGPGETHWIPPVLCGPRVEMAIDRFVKRRLERGPNVAALRIANELHKMHLWTRHAVELALIPQSDRCHDLRGRNLQPLTDWSLLLTVPTDELILTVQPGVQGSV
jgi:hypothetical protein